MVSRSSIVGGFSMWIVGSAIAASTSPMVTDQLPQDSSNLTSSNLDVQDKQPNDTMDISKMLWRKCSLQLSPTCLKLTLALLVDRLSQDTFYQPLPGVTLSTNHSSGPLEPPAASSRGDLGLAERLDEYLRRRVASYLRSLTLTVKPFDLPLLNTTGVLGAITDSATGRKKDGVGVGAVALMMGGAMMTMMMSALAALAGKAMMTSMMALMLAALSSLKGGGGGGGKSTTYEIIAQPHHSDHGWRRSVDAVRRAGVLA